MELTLHDAIYSEDTLDVYNINGSSDLIFYASEEFGKRVMHTHIKLDKNAQIGL